MNLSLRDIPTVSYPPGKLFTMFSSHTDKKCVLNFHDLINRIGSHNFNVNKLSYFEETKLSSLESDFLWFPDRI